MTNAEVLVNYFHNGLVPSSDMLYIVIILVIAAIALWQARTMVAKFLPPRIDLFKPARQLQQWHKGLIPELLEFA